MGRDGLVFAIKEIEWLTSTALFNCLEFGSTDSILAE